MLTRKRVSAQRESISVRTRWGWGPSASAKKLTRVANDPDVRELPTTNKIHDFDLIAFVNLGAVVERPLHDFEIPFDRNPPRIDIELREQGGNGHRPLEVEPISVQRDRQSITRLPDYSITKSQGSTLLSR